MDKDGDRREKAERRGTGQLSPFTKEGVSAPADLKVLCGMWARGDLNPQALRHKILSLACLPISPLARALGLIPKPGHSLKAN